MTHPMCINYGCMYELDLDGQITCILCGSKNDERDISGSYNGSTPVSETDNAGPTPAPEAISQTGYGYDELKDFDMGYKDSPRNRITPFRGPIK